MPAPTEKIESFDFHRMLLPEEFDWVFLLEVSFRTAVMFLLVLVFLKITGKRSVKQLSFFELAIVVGLGSAAGDPMFYHDVPLLPVLIVFATVGIFYKLLTYITKVSDKAEKLIEGKPDKLFENNLIIIANVDTDDLSYDEFFTFLRIRNVEHLGQVKTAYLETNGEVSIYYHPEEDVRPGLPILPDVYEQCFSEIPDNTRCACTRCGFTAEFVRGQQPACPHCGNHKWLNAISTKRIT